MEKKKNSLTKPWFLIIIFFCLTFLLFFGSRYYYLRLRSEMKAEQYKLLSAIASFKVNEITNWFSERKAEGLFFSGNPDFISMVQKLDESPANEQVRENIRLTLTPVKKNHDYSNIRVYNNNRKFLISVDDSFQQEQVLFDEGLFKTFNGKEIFFSDLKKGNRGDRMLMEMIVPIADRNKMVGLVVFTIDPGYFLFPLIQKYPVERNSAVNILAEQQGDSLLLIEGGGGSRSTIPKGISLVSMDAMVKSGRQVNTSTMIETKDYRGVDVIADVRMIPGSRWNLVSMIDLQEISAPLRERTLNIVLYIMTFMAVVITAMILNWKNQQLQHIRSKLELQDQTNKAHERITFMNALLEEVNDAIITFDKDMMIQSWNKGAERIYGWKAEEVIGKFGGGSLRVEFQGHSKAEAFREIEQTGAWKGEVVHKRKDGSTAYLLSSSSQLRDNDGNVLGIMAINKDITEVVQSGKIKNAVYRISELTHAARDLDEMYTAIHVVIGELMDAQNMYIALVEPDSKILTFPYFVDEKDTHPGSVKMGHGLTEYVLKTGKPLLSRPEDTQYFIDREIIEMIGTPAIDWLGIPLKNEKETFGVLVIQSYSPQVRYGEHEKNMLTFVSEQIALSIQRKKMQQELVDARQKAEVSSKLTSALLANMNHELRTPMNGILGFAEILLNELTDPDLKVKAENILNSGHRLMDTLDAIMDLSYLESDNISRKFKPVPVAQVFHSVIRNYERIILRKQLTYEETILPELTIMGDEHLFHHLIRILIDNAVKYTDKGSISVTASLVQKDGKDMVSIAVKDTGIGISNDYHRIIFDPFRQVSEGYGRQFEGSGLGLTIGKKIVDLMQGTIDLTSTLAEGSEFTVHLPCAPLVGIPLTTTAIEKPKPFRQKTLHKTLPNVLIVEDNMVNIQLLMIYIRKFCNIFTTVDAKTAIELAQKQKIDAVLMDINLGPGMDGIQAMLEIRGLPGYQSIPIIAVTGYASIGDRERLIQIGFTDYIPKPFDREMIAAVMTGLFSKG